LNLPVKVEGETLFQFVAVGVYTRFTIDRKGRLWGWGSGAKAHFPRPKLDRLEKPTLFKRAPKGGNIEGVFRSAGEHE
jgi:alpha-tubulin suppressor-like RCC1 family protein